MSTQADNADGVFTFQVAQAELGPLFVDLLKLDSEDGSPVAAPLGRYAKGSLKQPSAELKSVAADAEAAKAAAILAQPSWTMAHRTGGGSLPLSFFTAAHAPSIDADCIAVVAPSFDGSYFIQSFDSPFLFLAWWLDLTACEAIEPVANHIAPPTSYESLIYILHAVDLYKRAAMDSQLSHQPSETPSIAADSFGATFKTSVQSNDLRWLLPSFLALTPGLDEAGFDEDAAHLEALTRLEFLLPAKSDGSAANDRLMFGEAGRIMGVEFYRSWFQAAGFETRVLGGSGWRTANKGFLAPTGLANHLVLLDAAASGSGSPTVNHQAMTRDVFDGKMARLLTQSLTAPAEDEAATPAQADKSDQGGAAFCTNCGGALVPGKKFCADCGTPV